MSTFELVMDNAEMQIHCNETGTPDPDDPWTCLDLSTAVFLHGSPTNRGPYGQYDVGTGTIMSSSFGDPSFYFPGFTLDPTKTYQFRATLPDHGYFFGIMQENPSYASTFFSDNQELGFTFPSTPGEIFLTVGPGIDDWDTAISVGYQTLIRFDTPNEHLTSLCYKEV